MTAVRAVEAMDRAIDEHHLEVKRRLLALGAGARAGQWPARMIEILEFAENIEHIGDTIDKGLMKLAAKRIRNQGTLSDPALAELDAMQALVTQNLQTAINVFVSGDLQLARELVAAKAEVRAMSKRFVEHHYQRVISGDMVAMDTSSLQLDALSYLKRINDLATSAASMLLESGGEMEPTRLCVIESAD